MLKEKSILYPEIHLNRKPPVNLGAEDLPLFKNALNVTIAPVYLYYYENAYVTPEGIVFNKLFPEKQFLIYPYHTKIYNPLYTISSRVKRKKVKLPADEKYLLCFDYWSNNIFHWVCDVLPRLEAVKELAKDCVFLMPSVFKYEYFFETLKAFNLKDIHIYQADTYLNCSRLYVPQQITTSGEMSPENFRKLRGTLLSFFSNKFNGKYRFDNVYVSRSKAKWRKVLNEDDVIQVLKKYDFEVIQFEDYTIPEQIEIAYYAKNMVSAHGANLTNVIFMQENGNVLEFRKKNDHENNYYYSLADSVNCNYYYMNCEFKDTRKGNYFDTYVDLDLLELTVKKMLKV